MRLPGSPRRVLLLEHSPFMVELLARMVGCAGCRAQAVADVETASRLLDQYSFDALIVDMQLKDGNPLALVKKLKSGHLGQRLSVIMLDRTGLCEDWASDDDDLYILRVPVAPQKLACLLWRHALPVPAAGSRTMSAWQGRPDHPAALSPETPERAAG